MAGRVAFLGLGRMGRPMAANLAQKGHDLVVWNRTVARAEAFAAEFGADAAATPGEAVEGATVVVTMLADGPALEAVYTGDGGALGRLAEGAVAVDMGTSGPDLVAEVRRRILEVGGDLVDAPVSGSTPAAQAGTLQIMVGGEPGAVDTVRPVLEAMGAPVHVGPPGAGATLKLAVNALLLTFNQALAEAVVLAESAGVAPEAALDVIAGGAAGAPMVSYRRPQYLDPYDAPVTFTLALAAKDVTLAVEQAEKRGVSMTLGQETLAAIAELVRAGDGERDMGFVIEALRRSTLAPESTGGTLR